MNVDDDFEDTVRDELVRTVDTLEPSARLRARVDARVRARGRTRLAMRVGSAVLVASVAVGGLAWAQRGGPVQRTVTTTPAPISAQTTGAVTAVPTSVSVPTAAQNILVTGLDNDSCTDPDSPYAGGIGDRSVIGVRSDTIMVLRVDPASHSASLLSFPRDLWVELPGAGKGRINTTVERGSFDRLAAVLDQQFGIRVDHAIQVDFCAFKTIVDAVGGVTIPIPAAVRDEHVGIDLPPGCHTFDGDEALAYVRSRHLQVLDPSGVWQSDQTSDFGRIARQQDFVQRLFQAAISRGLLDEGVVRGLLQTIQQYVVIDSALSIDDMIGIGRLLAEIGPTNVTTAQVPARPATVAGSSVLIPDLAEPAAQQILAPFRGEAPAASVPTTAAEEPSILGDPVVPDPATTC